MMSANCFATEKCPLVLATLVNIGSEQIGDMIKVETEAWNDDQAASASTILARIHTNKSSSYILYDDASKKPIGSVVVVPMDTFDEQSNRPWNFYAELVTSTEHFHNLKQPKAWYVISLTATPSAPRGTGTILFQKLKIFARANNIESIYAGVRIANFRQHHLLHGTTIEKYLELLKQYDVSERAYGAAVRSGGVPKAILRNFYSDPSSMDFAILMAHQVQ
ncbi:MAG: hypothetical protein JWQ35_1236 [Bacteriovoracaceae bacterium]|nr:hypothetical protein [Bacteriovoracaceae bacterium]